ncbi:hypothetical protein HPP92_028007 [Vanilla planifolia]|uniref:Uncharacterized protein n=1 Tax=Vanilla planifolia TaxID=51239 RepID=A0A835PAZ2_VANPL|nr:hypothetical protein HPP92_028007 [Vanilla planifolia]KAG0448188.1 hypothetical protein HPP92_027970 [Vanilla planifolia]
MTRMLAEQLRRSEEKIGISLTGSQEVPKDKEELAELQSKTKTMLSVDSTTKSGGFDPKEPPNH